MQLRLTLVVLAALSFVGCSKPPEVGKGTESGAGSKPAAGAAKPAAGATLVGAWEITSASENGKTATKLIGKQVDFTAKQMTVSYPDGNLVQNYTLNPAKKFIDLVDAGDGRTFVGIYDLKGDQLRIACSAPYDKTRPTNFNGGSKTLLLTMRRKN